MDERVKKIAARLEAAMRFAFWPATEHPSDAEGEILTASGAGLLAMLGSEPWVTLGSNAVADIEYLLAEVDRLRNDIVGMQAIIDRGEADVARARDFAQAAAEQAAAYREALERIANRPDADLLYPGAAQIAREALGLAVAEEASHAR